MKQIFTVTLNPAIDLHYEIEALLVGQESYAARLLCQAGGKGVNISRALTVNGEKQTAYILMGRDNSDSFESMLRRDGIDFVPFYTDGRIRENVTLHPMSGAETRISSDGYEASEASLQQIEQSLAEHTHTGDLLAFAGRCPKGMPIASVVGLLKRQVERGLRLVLDSNSMDAEALKHIRPALIKPNEHEAKTLLGEEIGSRTDAAVAARWMVEKGLAESVLLSMGGSGAAWSDGTRSLVAAVPKLAQPVSTVGAGDSTLAGWLAGLRQGLGIEDVLRRALAYGTAACLTEGTAPPDKNEIPRIEKEIVIRWI